MRRLFAALDVDFDQWRALTAVLLKLDFRSSRLRSISRQQASQPATVILQLLLYSLFGIAMAFVVWYARELRLAATVSTTLTMFIVGSAVLLDHNSAITSPSDYGVLGFRPITSRTYFAVRLTNVLVYTTILTTIAVWLPAASFFIRYGARIGAAGIVAFYACSLATALAILTGYAWVLRALGPSAIQRALSYLQLAMSVGVYGGYAAMAGLLRSTSSLRWCCRRPRGCCSSPRPGSRPTSTWRRARPARGRCFPSARRSWRRSR